MNLARIQISLFSNCLSTLGRTVDALAVFNNIKNGPTREPVAQIRRLYLSELKRDRTGDRRKAKKAVEPLKKNLQGLTWSGTFSRRANEALIQYSGLICVDLDLLGERLAEVREKLKASLYLFALFLSPTADGLKAIFRVRPDPSKHFGSFLALQQHVLELTGVQIDESGKDLARLCFVSFDPEAYLNPNAQEIPPRLVVPGNQTAQKTTQADHGSKPSKEEIREMLSVIPKRPDYADWIKVVAAVGDALPVADAIELLCEWSPEEGDGEYADKLLRRLENIHVGTLIVLARAHGWTAEIISGGQRPGQTPELSSLNSSRVEANDGVVDDFPEPPSDIVYHGLAGDIVRRIEPHTEADPAALLIHVHAFFGNASGRNPHAVADGARHGMNINIACVGPTGKSRKGTALAHTKRTFRRVDEQWAKGCVTSGLSSGEGLIYSVRDVVTKQVKQKGGDYATEIVDEGVADKRCMFVESELASTLRVMTRDGNTLSAIIRQAWDGDDVLRTAVKNSPNTATGAHISIVGHVTRDEVRRELTATDQANGFANRFLWLAVRRSKCLPEGGRIEDEGLHDLVTRLHEAIEFARSAGEVTRDSEARELWKIVYPKLSEGRPGLLGAITARAEAQVLRLSCIYALLDCSHVITAEHHRAALALWNYCDRSAKWLFGSASGNPHADKILIALRVAGSKGLTRKQILDDVFQRNITGHALDEALQFLRRSRLARPQKEPTGGKPSERWFASKQ
jgi:hypothetical protein